MRKIIITVISVAAVIIVFSGLQSLLMPKYITEAQEGNLIAEYYNSEKNHDVVFIGDCEVYENIDPVVLWEEYGISSYVRGSPQQLIWMSYYLMEETLKYEKPDVFVFNVLSMKYGEPQSEAYNRLAHDGMRFSASKLKSVKASMTDGEDFVSYLFPLLRFHSRWSELDGNDLKYWFRSAPQISCAGYLMRVDTKGTDFFPPGKELSDYTFSDTCYKYLDKMTELCRENGIELVLMKAPSVSPYWYDQWEEQIVSYAERNGLLYYNFLNMSEQTGIDYMTDTYDGGLHLNLSGAQKLSKLLGLLLKQNTELSDHRGDPEYEASWRKIIEFHDKVEAYQKKELAEKGYISGFTFFE